MNYQEFATEIRKLSLQMTHDAKSAHIGSCLSIADILAVLYGGVLNVRPEEPDWEDRDRFILSKGHASAALYATLALKGFFPMSDLKDFYKRGYLSGHVCHKVKGVDVSTGSLGMGLSIGCGMALAAKRDKKKYRVFVLLSDGELNEGSTWEAAMFASHHRLTNITAIIDYNKLQAMGSTDEILDLLLPLADKWNSFGWSVCEVRECNGLYDTLRIDSPYVDWHVPNIVVVYTTKGQGVSFMENKVEWHYKHCNDEELNQALAELNK